VSKHITQDVCDVNESTHYINKSILTLHNILQCLYRRIYNISSLDRLSILRQSIKHKIEQAKSQIHESHNRAFIDCVLIEIDTLNWVLNEISQHSTFYKSRAAQGDV